MNRQPANVPADEADSASSTIIKVKSVLWNSFDITAMQLANPNKGNIDSQLLSRMYLNEADSSVQPFSIRSFIIKFLE